MAHPTKSKRDPYIHSHDAFSRRLKQGSLWPFVIGLIFILGTIAFGTAAWIMR